MPTKQRREAIRSMLLVDVESVKERREAIREMLEWLHQQPTHSDEQKAKMLIGMAKAYLGHMGSADAEYDAAMPWALNAVRSMANRRGRGNKATIKKDEALKALFAHFGCDVTPSTARKRKPAKL